MFEDLKYRMEENPWLAIVGVLIFFVLEFAVLSLLNIRVDSFSLMGIERFLTPLGITVITFLSVVVGVVTGLLRGE